MKTVPLTLCLAAILMVPSQLTLAETEDARRPTWIERLFGAEDPEEVAKGVKSKSDREEKQAEEAEEAREKDQAKQKEAREKAEKAKAKRQFSKEEREVLESSRQGNASWKQSKKPLPPGLQKKVARGGELPPGWKKKLVVGAVLDPEVDAQASSIPEEILRRLPESEAGTEILRVGDQIIRVLENSREIVDILDGADESEAIEE